MRTRRYTWDPPTIAAGASVLRIESRMAYRSTSDGLPALGEPPFAIDPTPREIAELAYLRMRPFGLPRRAGFSDRGVIR